MDTNVAMTRVVLLTGLLLLLPYRAFAQSVEPAPSETAPPETATETDAEGTPAEGVTFTDLHDAVPDRFFDAASSAADPANPATLIIGFNHGLDPRTFDNRDFTASLLAFTSASAADTLALVVHAPAGSYVTSITYLETLKTNVTRLGRSFASTQLVINGIPTEQTTVDLSSQCLTDVPMSITTSLVAASAGVTLTDARVVVSVAPQSSADAAGCATH